MAAGLTLDAGSLIAADEGDRTIWKYCKEAAVRGARVTVPAAVLAQAWRGNRPLLARLLAGCDVEVLDEARGKRTGELLAKRGTADIVDAIVALGAIARGDTVLTSDPDNLEGLVAAAGGRIKVLRV